MALFATDYETAADIILQKWNDFGFKFITKEDYPKILTHLRENFYLDEPMCQCLGMTADLQDDLARRVTNVMNLGHGSFYAYPLDNPEQVAAVLLIWFHEENEQLPQTEVRSPLFTLVRKVVIATHNLYNVYENHGVKSYPELYIMSTDKHFRGKGLATEMYRKAIEKFKEQGLPLVTSSFSSPFTRKIGEKLGFEVKATLNFEDVKNPDGSLVLGEASRGQYSVETVLLLK